MLYAKKSLHESGAGLPGAGGEAHAAGTRRHMTTGRNIPHPHPPLLRSVFTPGGFFPPGTTKVEKRAIAPKIPVWKSETCTQCNICAFVCPHAAIRPVGWGRGCQGGRCGGSPQGVIREQHIDMIHASATSPDRRTSTLALEALGDVFPTNQPGGWVDTLTHTRARASPLPLPAGAGPGRRAVLRALGLPDGARQGRRPGAQGVPVPRAGGAAVPRALGSGTAWAASAKGQWGASPQVAGGSESALVLRSRVVCPARPCHKKPSASTLNTPARPPARSPAGRALRLHRLRAVRARLPRQLPGHDAAGAGAAARGRQLGFLPHPAQQVRAG